MEITSALVSLRDMHLVRKCESSLAAARGEPRGAQCSGQSQRKQRNNAKIMVSIGHNRISVKGEMQSYSSQ